MCGIISYFSNETKYDRSIVKLLHNLLWIDSVRGDHSTGLIYHTDGGADWYKKAIPGWDFVQLQSVQTLLEQSNKMGYLIGHNRAATRGDVNSNNAHPFQFKHITGVHNGTLHQYANLVKGHHKVDSQYLYDALATDGWDMLVPKLQGSFNLLWHDSRDDTIHMCKNETRPYTFAKLKGVDILLGASEKPMLKWLIGKHGFEIEYCWTPKDNVEYIWDVKNCMVKPTHVVHKGYVAPPTPARTVYTPPANKGQAVKDKNIEFWIHTSYPNDYVRRDGDITYTLQGTTVDNEAVRIYGAMRGEFELDTWYIAPASFMMANSAKGSWLVTSMALVKKHPLEGPHDALVSCINCGEAFPESELLFVDNAPACIDCCQQLNVKPDQVSVADAALLFH